MRRTIFTEEHELFRQSVRAFCEKECVPHIADWEKAGGTGREIWRKAGEPGLLGFEVPEEFGGAGSDFRYNAILGRGDRRHWQRWASGSRCTTTSSRRTYAGQRGAEARWLPASSPASSSRRSR